MKRIFTLIVATMSLLNLSAREFTHPIDIQFNVNQFDIDPTLPTNVKGVKELSNLLSRTDSLTDMARISIVSYASPESSVAYNNKLCERRNESIYQYIKSKGIVTDSVKVDQVAGGVAWDKLSNLIAGSDMADKEALINIINTVPEETWGKANPTDTKETLLDSRRGQLMRFKGGSAYNLLKLTFFPMLRSTQIVTTYVAESRIVLVEVEQQPEPKAEPAPAPKPEPTPEPEPEVVPETTPEPTPAPVVDNSPELIPFVALKTNMLYDVMGVLNGAVEFYLSPRMSIEGEWIFPWWTSCKRESVDRRRSIQLLNGNVTAKYWLGDRESALPMTGWFVGATGGGGKYDLEIKERGYQGEFFTVGAMGGFAHTINRSGTLRLEYSLSLGYMHSDYDRYLEHVGFDGDWHNSVTKSSTLNWVGPTSARVSLAWLLYRKSKK